MAQDKKKVIVYADWIIKFEALDDAEAGRLIKHFFRYINDLNPTYPDRITEISFLDIQNTLKRDLKKWEKRAESSRENGKSGGRPQNPKKPTETQQVILEPKEPVKDIDNGSGIVKDTVTDIEKKNESLSLNNLEMHEIQKFVSEKLKIVPTMKTQLTFENCVELEKKYPRELIIEKLTAMDNKPDLKKKYVSVYLTVNTWCRDFNKDHKTHPYTQHKKIKTEW